MKKSYLLPVLLVLLGCSGMSSYAVLEQGETGEAATGLADWTSGSQFTHTQANILKNAIDANAADIATKQDAMTAGTDYLAPDGDASQLTIDAIAELTSTTIQDVIEELVDRGVYYGGATAYTEWGEPLEGVGVGVDSDGHIYRYVPEYDPGEEGEVVDAYWTPISFPRPTVAEIEGGHEVERTFTPSDILTQILYVISNEEGLEDLFNVDVDRLESGDTSIVLTENQMDLTVGGVATAMATAGKFFTGLTAIPLALADEQASGTAYTSLSAKHSVVPGRMVYFDSVTNQWDYSERSTAGKFPPRGMTIQTANADVEIYVLKDGSYRLDATFAEFPAGTALCVSDSDGILEACAVGDVTESVAMSWGSGIITLQLYPVGVALTPEPEEPSALVCTDLLDNTAQTDTGSWSFGHSSTTARIANIYTFSAIGTLCEVDVTMGAVGGTIASGTGAKDYFLEVHTTTTADHDLDTLQVRSARVVGAQWTDDQEVTFSFDDWAYSASTAYSFVLKAVSRDAAPTSNAVVDATNYARVRYIESGATGQINGFARYGATSADGTYVADRELFMVVRTKQEAAP